MEWVINHRRPKQKPNLVASLANLNLIDIFLFEQVAL